MCVAARCLDVPGTCQRVSGTSSWPRRSLEQNLPAPVIALVGGWRRRGQARTNRGERGLECRWWPGSLRRWRFERLLAGSPTGWFGLLEAGTKPNERSSSQYYGTKYGVPRIEYGFTNVLGVPSSSSTPKSAAGREAISYSAEFLDDPAARRQMQHYRYEYEVLRPPGSSSPDLPRRLHLDKGGGSGGGYGGGGVDRLRPYKCQRGPQRTHPPTVGWLAGTTPRQPIRCQVGASLPAGECQAERDSEI
ncbi:hypothetical protein DCS_07948 [Drechmeria coniospora]|uniref:Uncharacterized protein n=1 Tax=Drechmeria coniospora TaxID=98403 RepID=A0A151GFV2_DRECN|nr:hypothetical protein DCS_07948 [Drechmeria coniospora]KYK55983.1 hypothetical protein DCS_07948 [Drechmeria coniospora]